jgi:hypothetical protein
MSGTTERGAHKRGTRTLGMAGVAMVTVVLAALVPANALAEGGKAISTAPSVVYGQQEFGNTASGQFLEGSCGTGLFGGGDGWRSYWALEVTAGDLLTINWEGTSGTELKIAPPGTTDYTLFQANPVVSEELSSNLKNQAQYSVPLSGILPLYFRVCSDYGTPGPYSFTVTAQHGLSVNLPPRPNIRTNSVIHGSAGLVSGAPAPNGMTFTLTASWSNGSVSYNAVSTGGSLAFTLALPEELEGQTIALALNRAADSQYLAPAAAEIQTHVARPRVQPKPVTHRHLRCHGHSKKRTVHGKVRCVKVRHQHHHRHRR